MQISPDVRVSVVITTVEVANPSGAGLGVPNASKHAETFDEVRERDLALHCNLNLAIPGVI